MIKRVLLRSLSWEVLAALTTRGTLHTTKMTKRMRRSIVGSMNKLYKRSFRTQLAISNKGLKVKETPLL
jgi:hypothetical protein